MNTGGPSNSRESVGAGSGSSLTGSSAAVVKAPVGLPSAPSAEASGVGVGHSNSATRTGGLLGSLLGRSGGAQASTSADGGRRGSDADMPLSSRQRDGSAAPRISKERARLEAQRSDKWLKMLGDWRGWMGSEAKRTQARNRCRKGIPEAMRGRAWQVIVDSPGVRQACGGDGAYKRLLSLKLAGQGGPTRSSSSDGASLGGAAGSPGAGAGAAADAYLLRGWSSGGGKGVTSAPSAPGAASARPKGGPAASDSAKVTVASADIPPLVPAAALFRALEGRAEGHATPDIVDTIERDINRTFPHISLFSQVGGLGQTSLFRVLVAYAQLNDHVGYCQGMGFIAALFLSYMPEEDAFWLFASVMQHEPHCLAHLFGPGLPLSGQLDFQLEALLKRKLPKLAAHLDR